MPWPTEPLADRERRLREGVASQLGFVETPSPTSNVGALTQEVAAEVDDIHQHVAHQARQTFAETADEEHLEAQHGRPLGLLRHAPVAARGPITLTGVDGSILPAATLLRHGDGRNFLTVSEAVIAGGMATVSVVASEAGLVGNVNPGETLILSQSFPGIDAEVTTVEGILGGEDLEPLETYRQRIRFRKAHPPGAGHLADYSAWTMAVPGGITHVWVKEMEMGLGTVTVRFATFDAPGGPIPNEELRQAVQDHLDGHLNPVTGEWQGRPGGMQIYVVTPTARPIDLTFSELLPNDQVTLEAVSASVSAMLRERATPGATIRLDWINEAISRATGEDRHLLAFPTENVVCTVNELATVGVLTPPGA